MKQGRVFLIFRILCAILFLFEGCDGEPWIVPLDYGETAVQTVAVQTTAPATIAENTPQPIVPATTAPKVPEIRKTSFIGAGDCIIYYGNVRDAKSLAGKGGSQYNFKPHFANVADKIAAADIAYINQETLMCGNGYALSYYPLFNSPQEVGYTLAEVGFDVVNIANNHMLDKGADGLAKTIDFWHSVDRITLIGGYRNAAEMAEPHIIEKNGIKIAFLSYTSMTNSLKLPESSQMVIPYINKENAKKQIAKAHEEADCVIVSVHWGEENTFTPSQEQKDFAQFLANQDVDVIIGTHPHVIQPIEWLSNAESGHRTLCAYSLGNFIAEMSNDYNMLGGMLSFDIVSTDGTVTVEQVVFQPTVYYFTTTFYQNQVYLWEDFTEDLASSHGLIYYGKKLKRQNLQGYIDKVIAKEFLP